MKLSVTTTPGGKPKIVDESGFSVCNMSANVQKENEANAVNICNSYNHTIGSGINPESVGEIKDALQSMIMLFNRDLPESSIGARTVLTAQKALKKSKL